MDNQTLEYLNHLITQYGYLVLILFTFLEGETIVIIAGAFVHSGTLNFYLVAFSSLLGAFLGDQLYFFLGRKYGKKILAKKPNLENKANKVMDIISKNESLLILSFRFLYGLRTITPIALGLSKIKYFKFLFLNLIGAIIWAFCFTYLGYIVAKSVKNLIINVNHYQYIATVLIIIISIVIFIIYKTKKKRKIENLGRKERNKN